MATETARPKINIKSVEGLLKILQSSDYEVITSAASTLTELAKYGRPASLSNKASLLMFSEIPHGQQFSKGV